MIKVLIVEDEPPIARVLGKLIKEINPEFSVLGYAENGKEAIGLYEELYPEVIFMDIRMPVLDGFGLLEYLKERNETVFTVILSGYNEFEYARKAISYRVYDYMLKPVSPTGLESLLERLQRDVEFTQKQEKYERFQESLHRDKNEKTGFVEGKHKLCLFCAGSFPVSPDDTMLPGTKFWNDVAIEKMMNEVMGEGIHIWQIQGITTVEKLLIWESEQDELENRSIEVLFQEISQMSNFPVTAICGSKGLDMSSIGVGASMLRREMRDNIVFGRSKLLFLSDWDKSLDKQAWENREIIQSLDMVIEGYKKSHRLDKKTLDKFLERCEKAHITQQYLIRYLSIIISYSTDMLFDAKVLDPNRGDKLWNKDWDLQTILSNIYSYEQLIRELDSIMEEEEIAEVTNPILEDVKNYVKEHYMDSISNEFLAKKYGFATAYLCRIFKNQYAISLSNYLIRKRMEKAKELLKSSGNLLVKEIAEQVGYQDPYYFSKVFNKETGFWPTEYK